MTAAPAVSVVMPVYNAARHLREAVQSVLRQTFRDFELVAVDDGSTDESPAVLREYAARDPRVRVVSRPNTGIVGALNDGLDAARGPLVARMDADDVCLPRRFERQAAFLRDNPACLVVGTRVRYTEPNGRPICDGPVRVTHEEIDAHQLSRWNGADAPQRHDAGRRRPTGRRVPAGVRTGRRFRPVAAPGRGRSAREPSRRAAEVSASRGEPLAVQADAGRVPVVQGRRRRLPPAGLARARPPAGVALDPGAGGRLGAKR